ncbi:DNA repair protein RecN [Halanaerocella petrolearia]
MLSNLVIKNFALIDEVELEFDLGLNILTGETGAGKSIIVKALEMLLGGRASTDFIRQGENKAIVEACFDISNNKLVKEEVKELGIELSADDNLILTREINHTTNNKSRINGRIVTLETTRQISQCLIDLHNQHEYQMLLSSTDQLEILDQLGNEELLSLRAKVGTVYQKLQSKKKALTQLRENQKERERRIDLLKFQLQEIEEADLKLEEEKELLAERKRLSNAEELSQTVGNIYNQLYTSDYQQSGIIDQLKSLSKKLEGLITVDEDLEEVVESLRNTTYQLEDISFQLSDYQAEIEFNPQRLTIVEDRLETINDLKRKYGDSVEEILDYYQQSKKELAKLKNNKQSKEQLKAEIEELETEYLTLAKELSQLRHQVASLLEDNILTELADLAIDEAKFKVDFTKKENFSQYGIDKIDFLLAPNPGSELKSLAEIASGGELSRVMLILKSLMARINNVTALVFDEIDTGIGGRVAKLVANKLVSLSQNYQLLCITHLPQIACQADKHYLINKQVEEGVTYTHINSLTEQQRIRELARMLDGSADQTALKHAEELLKGA